MNFIYVLDQKNGMMFNKRRQSTDEFLVDNIVDIANESNGTLWVSEYSLPLFKDIDVNLAKLENFNFKEARETDFVFIENIDLDLSTVVSQLDKESSLSLYLYKWDKTYPSDKKFELEKWFNHFEVVEKGEFKGKIHDVIFMEHWELIKN